MDAFHLEMMEMLVEYKTNIDNIYTKLESEVDDANHVHISKLVWNTRLDAIAACITKVKSGGKRDERVFRIMVLTLHELDRDTECIFSQDQICCIRTKFLKIKHLVWGDLHMVKVAEQVIAQLHTIA